MDLPSVSISDLENYYINSEKYELAENERKTIKSLKLQSNGVVLATISWNFGIILAEAKLNMNRFSKYKGFYNLGARLPFISFHIMNLIFSSKVATVINQEKFDRCIDIVSKYDKDARILKYKNAIYFGTR